MKQILSNDIINQYLPTLIHCPLFNKLGEPELKGYLHNAKVIVHSYKKMTSSPSLGILWKASVLFSKVALY